MAKAASKKSPEQREQEEAAKHAPVSLPSGGSFDREALQEGLDKAVDGRTDNRDAEVRKALEKAKDDEAGHTDRGPSVMPGHKTVESEVQLAPGTDVGDGKTEGAVVVTERHQVFDSKAAEEADQPLAASGGQAISGQHSEVLSTKDAEPLDEPVTDSAPRDADAGAGE